jgi:superfamily II DNA/RNA helicase
VHPPGVTSRPVAEPSDAGTSAFAALQQVTVPDLWQQEAVVALRAGHDVVVHAPTGAGKTFVFELWSNNGRNRGQAIYTVPTRALANDKLAEWRARGWNVGIATGDLSDNLSAPVLVATLETQKNRLIHGDGPSLLVVDEYQMLADEDRGLNYELAIALAPPDTQLLLLSGSVANPQHVVDWLRRLGRKATLVRHEVRPVPLDEVFVHQLSWRLPPEIRSHWARFTAKALADSLGPVLLFAPRRQQAEIIAAEIARELPNPNPLQLSDAQRRLVGEPLARLLKSRVAFHHSGLSYAARAGVIEPLAKNGQLRVVVATMGLAAGINFSLRSVALTADSYKRDGIEIPIRPDEILQMFGRAGRRGIDETGHVLASPDGIRLRDAQAAFLARSRMVDWSALLNLMAAATDQGKDPFAEAVRVQSRLFTTKPIFLGVEESLRNPVTPCGLKTDAERARHVRRHVRQMLNSKGEWEPFPTLQERPLHQIFHPIRNVDVPGPGDAPVAPHLKPALTQQVALEKVGTGGLAKVAESPDGPVFGRTLIVAERLDTDRVILSKWTRRLTGWHGRQAPIETWHGSIAPLLEQHFLSQQFPIIRFDIHPQHIVAVVSLAQQTLRVPVDSHGVALWRPPERDIFPPDCAACHLTETCRSLTAATGTALLWRRLELVDERGHPTRRGRIVSFFQGGIGLAVAAALEDASYPLDELLFDLANLDAGFRFCGDDNRWGGRLAVACHAAYGIQNIDGYLENGVPPKYGDGANLVVHSIHRDPWSKHRFVTDILGNGDVDRIIIEWRSLLRQVSHAPPLDWERWGLFQSMAKALLHETESPTDTRLPPLEHHQQRRIDHRLQLRRH